jgi:hypothetical protein
MKPRIALTMAAVLLPLAALPQVRFTSFTSSGALTWTNSAIVGAYSLEWADRPAGPWRAFDTLTNLNSIWVTTNWVSVQVPVTNTPAFYRVAWIPPDPIGVWDYRGFDRHGTLVITGQLNMSSSTVLATDPGVNRVLGSWNLQYAGPPTNELWYLGPQIGTGSLGGNLTVDAAYLFMLWPTNVIDYNIELFGTIWPNTYTGTWVYAGISVVAVGHFSARRLPSSSLQTNPTKQ